jgi:ABC-type transport system substrate-binding protein
MVRVAIASMDIDSLDPALAYRDGSWSLLSATCTRLLSSPLEPEVAARRPKVSRDGRTYTFTLRSGFRFSDGAPLRADAFARAIERTLTPGVDSPWAVYWKDIVGARRFLAGRAPTINGLEADGNTLVIELERPVAELPARVTSLCAVPPNLPADREGTAEFDSAGPYYISEYRTGERAVLLRNRFYDGDRPQRVAGFTADLSLSSQDQVLDQVEAGKADWGWALPPVIFNRGHELAAKYGINRSRFFVGRGAIFRGYAFNTSRPLFRDNPSLRRAVSFAIDRAAFRRVSGGPASSVLTDQYMPRNMKGFRDADIYPLRGPDFARARKLARGNTRGGKAVLFTIDLPNHRAFALSIKQNLRRIGLDVTIRWIPIEAYFGGLMARGAYDLGFATWIPDFDDPFSVLNVQLDGRFIGETNWARFDEPKYNRLLRHAAQLRGAARFQTYGALDARIAREAAPMVAIDFMREATLVSARIGCVRQPFDLAAVCLR